MPMPLVGEATVEKKPCSGRRRDSRSVAVVTTSSSNAPADSLGWADRTPVSAHVLRHTAITAVGRLAGYPVAQAFAGHAAAGTTGRYLHASIDEVADAIATLTGDPHPLVAGPLPRARPGRCRTR